MYTLGLMSSYMKSRDTKHCYCFYVLFVHLASRKDIMKLCFFGCIVRNVVVRSFHTFWAGSFSLLTHWIAQHRATPAC